MAKGKRQLPERSGLEASYLKKIGKNITRLASQKRVSIERLAYESGVSKGYAYDVVKGIGNPSALILFRIADSLGVPVQSLFK